MEEPGLDDRHRDEDGTIHKKRSDAVNKNLPHPIPEFSPLATVGFTRKAIGEESLKNIEKAAKKLPGRGPLHRQTSFWWAATRPPRCYPLASALSTTSSRPSD